MGAGQGFNCGRVGAGVPALPGLPNITENLAGVEITMGGAAEARFDKDYVPIFGVPLVDGKPWDVRKVRVEVRQDEGPIFDLKTDVLGHPDKNHLSQRDISDINQWYLLEQMKRVYSGAVNIPNIWGDVGSSMRLTPGHYEVIAYDVQLGAEPGPLIEQKAVGDQAAWYGGFTPETTKAGKQADRWASGGPNNVRTYGFLEIARDKLRAGLGLVNNWYMKLIDKFSVTEEELAAKSAAILRKEALVNALNNGWSSYTLFIKVDGVWQKEVATGVGTKDFKVTVIIPRNQHEKWAMSGGVKKPE